MPTYITLPDLLANWPWQRAINPSYAHCRDESQAWIHGFGILTPEAQSALDTGNPTLLAALAYPNVDRAGCRVVCDLMYIYGIFDTLSDMFDAKTVRKWSDIIMDALLNPQLPRPSDELILGEIVRSFWCNAMKTVAPSAQKCFIAEFGYYMEAVVEQAQYRDQFIFRDIESYMGVRRKDLGARPAFALMVMDRELEMPDEAYENETLVTLRSYAVDMLCLANDIYSFNREQSMGDDHNIVALMTLHHDISVQEAIEQVAAMHDALVEQFLAVFNTLSPSDRVWEYANGLGNWIRANECWSFEIRRYFNEDGLRVQQTRVLEMLPKSS